MKAFVTGASSGLGASFSKHLVKRGYTVYAAARRLDMLQKLATETNGKVIPIELDVKDTHRTVEVIQRLDSECGGFDLCIANAGVNMASPAESATWKDVEHTLQVNVMGAAATLTAIAPLMANRNKGNIAGISSLAANLGLSANSAYSGSKAFLSMFMKAMQSDLSGTGVKVTIVEPGFVKSELTDKIKDHVSIPFMAETDVATEVYLNAILSGKRMVRYPRIHSMGVSVLGMLPAPIFERVAKSQSKTQRTAFGLPPPK
jgi:short-subunit dehydrogenase